MPERMTGYGSNRQCDMRKDLKQSFRCRHVSHFLWVFCMQAEKLLVVLLQLAPDHELDQPVGRPLADPGHRLLGRNHRARQGPDPEPGVDGDAFAGQPEPAERAVAAALSPTA